MVVSVAAFQLGLILERELLHLDGSRCFRRLCYYAVVV